MYYCFIHFGGWTADIMSYDEAVRKLENGTVSAIFADIGEALKYAYQLPDNEYVVRVLENYLAEVRLNH